MVEIKLSFPSMESAAHFMSWFTSNRAPANPLPQPEGPQVTPQEPLVPPVAAPAGAKRGPKPKTEKTQATVVAPSANATTATDNGASVQPATPPEAGAKAAAEAQLPLTGVELPPAGQKEYTVDEMRQAAQDVIAKFGQIDGMAKARDAMVAAAGVKLIRDVPADKVSATAAAFVALLA